MYKTPTAWMLRRDGIAFPCQWHDYGNTDPAEVEETLMLPKPTPSPCCGIRRAPDTANIGQTRPAILWIMFP